MKLLTMQEIMLFIIEETRDVDPEITEDIILKEAVISHSEIEKLKTKLRIDTLDEVFAELILSRSLKTIFQHKACTDKLYAGSFYKVQKNSHSSFEVICCRS